MFDKIRQATIEKYSDEIKKKTEQIADSLTDKISDISEAVQSKTDSVSKSVEDLLDTNKKIKTVDIDFSVEVQTINTDIILESSVVDSYGQQQQTVDEAERLQQDSVAASYQVLEDRRKKRKGKSIAAIAASALVAIGGMNMASEHAQNVAMAESYDVAVSHIISEEYDLAVEDLTEVNIEDSEALARYAYVQSNIDAYVGKPDKMLEEIEGIDSIENAEVKKQQDLACEDLKLAGDIQESIDKLDLRQVSQLHCGKQVDSI